MVLPVTPSKKILQLKITIWILSIRTFNSRKKPNNSLQKQTLIFLAFQNLPIPDQVIMVLRQKIADRILHS